MNRNLIVFINFFFTILSIIPLLLYQFLLDRHKIIVVDIKFHFCELKHLLDSKNQFGPSLGRICVHQHLTCNGLMEMSFFSFFFLSFNNWT